MLATTTVCTTRCMAAERWEILRYLGFLAWPQIVDGIKALNANRDMGEKVGSRRGSMDENSFAEIFSKASALGT